MSAIDPSQFVQEDQELDDFLCNICKKVVVLDADPVLCKDEHLFCRRCITLRISSDDATCPVDGAELHFVELTSSKRTARAASRLAVKCTNYASGKSLRVVLGQVPGCRWHGSVHELSGHLEKCEYRLVECLRCSEKVQYRAQRLHDLYCSNVEEPCSMCGKNIPLRETHTHLEDCDGVCVPCPNMCLRSDSAQSSSSALNDVTFIRRKDIEAHRVDCPFEVVSCPFRAVGCSVQNGITRIDLAHHLSSAVQSHLVLLLKVLGNGIGGFSDGGRRKRGYHDGLEGSEGIQCKKARVNGMVPDSSTQKEEGDPITERPSMDMGIERSNETRLTTMADQLKALISFKQETTPFGGRVAKCEERMIAMDSAMDESKIKQDNDFNAVRAHLKKLDDRFAALNGEARKTAQSLRKFREDMLKRVDAGDASLRGMSARCKSLADENNNLKATVLSFREQADAGNSVTKDCLHAIEQMQDDVRRLRALLPRESEATRGDLESKDAATHRDPEAKLTSPSSDPQMKHASVHGGHQWKDSALPANPDFRGPAPQSDPNSKPAGQCDRPEAENIAEPAELGSKVLTLTHTSSCIDATEPPQTPTIEVLDQATSDLHASKVVEGAAQPFSNSATAPVTRIGRVGDVGVVAQKTPSPVVLESKTCGDRTNM
jgi:hypothetical protein